MAIHAYVGLPGSGKTYEVVTTVMLEAMRQGRRVVTNIRGVNVSRMWTHLVDVEKLAPEAIGEVVVVELQAVLDNPSFFYSEHDPSSVVQPGDLLVIDECWALVPKGDKLKDRMMMFFRMHRQYVSAKGVSCDVVMISQDIGDFNNLVRVVIEGHFKMTKLTALGATKRYRVDVYQGWEKRQEKDRQQFYLRTYNADFFEFYSSYAGKGGDERVTDKRSSLFHSVYFRFVIPAAVVGFIASAWGMTRIYSHYVHKGDADKKADAQVSPGVRSLPGGVSGEPNSGDWRAVGFYSSNGRMVAVLEKSGRVRYLANPASFLLTGNDYEVYVDGKLATRYSGSVGAARQSGLLGGH